MKFWGGAWWCKEEAPSYFLGHLPVGFCPFAVSVSVHRSVLLSLSRGVFPAHPPAFIMELTIDVNKAGGHAEEKKGKESWKK